MWEHDWLAAFMRDHLDLKPGQGDTNTLQELWEELDSHSLYRPSSWQQDAVEWMQTKQASVLREWTNQVYDSYAPDDMDRAFVY